ncbi:MAG: SDR family oxidoreductase [Phycisphaerae bacterium]|nr:SDR family oxidoreductase [Phycisphaerae bacterium]
MKLEGTVALVTGGARRVGRAIALELAGAGCDIALHCHESCGDARGVADRIVAAGRRCEIVSGDLRRPEAAGEIVERTVAALGGLEILVNNASIFERMTLQSFSIEDWDRTMRINVTAPVALAAAAREHLLRAGGKIINLCDIAADRPWPEHLAYCASKAALACLTKALARALAPTVQVNSVAPGIAMFPEDYGDEVRQRLVDKVPLKRAGTPEDIARTVRFLAESGDYVTGQILNVDGGRSIR